MSDFPVQCDGYPFSLHHMLVSFLVWTVEHDQWPLLDPNATKEMQLGGRFLSSFAALLRIDCIAAVRFKVLSIHAQQALIGLHI